MRQFRPRGLSQSWWKLEIRWNFELEAESSVHRPEWWSEHNTATEHGILRSQSGREHRGAKDLVEMYGPPLSEDF
jgi:hypothetical protein